VSTNVAVGAFVVAMNSSEPPVLPYTFHAVAVGYAASSAVASTVTVLVAPVVTIVLATLARLSMPPTTTVTIYEYVAAAKVPPEVLVLSVNKAVDGPLNCAAVTKAFIVCPAAFR
jgi:hypothetical protein